MQLYLHNDEPGGGRGCVQIHILDSIFSPQAQKTGCHGLPKAYFAALKAEAGLVGVTRDHLPRQSFPVLVVLLAHKKDNSDRSFVRCFQRRVQCIARCKCCGDGQENVLGFVKKRVCMTSNPKPHFSVHTCSFIQICKSVTEVDQKISRITETDIMKRLKITFLGCQDHSLAACGQLDK